MMTPDELESHLNGLVDELSALCQRLAMVTKRQDYEARTMTATLAEIQERLHRLEVARYRR